MFARNTAAYSPREVIFSHDHHPSLQGFLLVFAMCMLHESAVSTSVPRRSMSAEKDFPVFLFVPASDWFRPTQGS